MSFTSIGTLGSVQNKTANQVSTALTTTANAAAGSLAVLIVAVDNSGTVDADNAEISGVTDSAGGNTWTKAAEWTNSNASAQAGATVSMWYSVLTNAIASSGTITASFTSSANRDAVCLTAWNFSVASGSTVSVQTSAHISQDGAIGGAGSSLTTGSLANQEWLFIRGYAVEGIPGGWTSGWGEINNGGAYTMFTHNSTSGGGAASNMNVGGQWRIVTTTTQTTIITSSTGTFDEASIQVVFKENLAVSNAGGLGGMQLSLMGCGQM